VQPDARTTTGGRRRRLGAAFALAAVVLWCVVAGFFISGGGSEAVRTVWIDVALVVLDLLAALTAVLAGRAEHLERRTRVGWQLVGLAFAFRAVADGIWWWLEAVQGEQPFPSLADLFYVLFVPTLLAALLTFPVRRRTRGEQQRLWLDIAIVLVGAFMVVWYLVLGPTAQMADASLATLLSITYPIGDLVLMFGLAALFVRGVGSLVRGPLYLLMLGVCSFVAADLGFAAASLGDGYATGSWPDFAFLGASALVALAAAAQLRSRSAGARAAVVVRDGMTLLANPLPYLGVALGYGLLVWVGRDESPYGLGGLLLSAVLITLLVLARQITETRDNERLARRFEEIAVTDALTGLANRRRLLEAAEQAVTAADGDEIALVVIDVDRFKEVNDTLGHLAGDVVIRAVADRIRAAVRPDDLAARYGGDEFVVLMPGLGGVDALAVTRRLAAAVCADPVHTPAGPVHVTLSIGVAHVAGTPAVDAVARVEQLLTRADNALYEVKRRGRDGVHLATA
jgi:diguanylate cyclase (GGDEF)-like protein